MQSDIRLDIHNALSDTSLDKSTPVCTHHIEVFKLDIVALDDIDVFDIQPLKTLVHRACHPLSTEIEQVSAIPTNFGGKHKLLAGNILQGLAKNLLGERKAIEAA